MARRAKKEMKSRKTVKIAGPGPCGRNDAGDADALPASYWKACELVQEGQYKKAKAAYARLERSTAKGNARVRTLIQNDLAVIAAMEGQLAEACKTWRTVLDRGDECLTARLNIGLVEAELSRVAHKLERDRKRCRAGARRGRRAWD